MATMAFCWAAGTGQRAIIFMVLRSITASLFVCVRLIKRRLPFCFQSHGLDVIVLQSDGSFLLASIRINGGEFRCRHVHVLTTCDDVDHIFLRVVANGIRTRHERYDAFDFIG